jgi:hypothetical protein
MKTLLKRTEVLMAAFAFSLILNAQTTVSDFNGNLTSTKISRLNSSAIKPLSAKTEKTSNVTGNLHTKSNADLKFENRLENELNSITQQISETVKFRLDSKTVNDSKNDVNESLNALTDEIGERIKYQPVSCM